MFETKNAVIHEYNYGRSKVIHIRLVLNFFFPSSNFFPYNLEQKAKGREKNRKTWRNEKKIIEYQSSIYSLTGRWAQSYAQYGFILFVVVCRVPNSKGTYKEFPFKCIWPIIHFHTFSILSFSSRFSNHEKHPISLCILCHICLLSFTDTQTCEENHTDSHNDRTRSFPYEKNFPHPYKCARTEKKIEFISLPLA